MGTGLQKRLIVNADDFGLSHGVNDGVVRCYEHGILTSASLMVRRGAAATAGAYARLHPDLSVGLHVDLGEWVYRDGQWGAVYEVVSQTDREAVSSEIRRQLDGFHRLTGNSPSHLDSHQHVHLSGPAREVMCAIASELNVPLRKITPGIHFRGDFYGQSGKGDPHRECITPAALVRILESLPPGITELGCHPGNDPELDSAYRLERAIELATLCDPVVASAIDELKIELCSFRNCHSAWPLARTKIKTRARRARRP